jgi:hypothetical protein
MKTHKLVISVDVDVKEEEGDESLSQEEFKI